MKVRDPERWVTIITGVFVASFILSLIGSSVQVVLGMVA